VLGVEVLGVEVLGVEVLGVEVLGVEVLGVGWPEVEVRQDCFKKSLNIELIYRLVFACVL
jgi:hypothetical protein